MKKIHLFATKWWYFLVCLPPLFVFILCLIYHPRTTTKLGLFPLEFAMLGVIAFSIMFFVRTVRISFEEVRVTGIFSDHDHMDMVLGRQIILVQYPHNNLGIYVYGEDFAEAEAIILPGGMPGTINLRNCERLRELIASENEKGTLICAICAAPSVLGNMGLLKGKNATCFPGFEEELAGAVLSPDFVVKDGNIITAKGAGVAFEFGFEILSLLKDSDTSKALKSQMQFATEV